MTDETLAAQGFPLFPMWQQFKVLDVGCGGGFTCEFLAQRGAQMTGIDQSAACIEAANRHAITANLNIDYRQGQAEQLLSKDSSCNRLHPSFSPINMISEIFDFEDLA